VKERRRSTLFFRRLKKRKSDNALWEKEWSALSLLENIIALPAKAKEVKQALALRFGASRGKRGLFLFHRQAHLTAHGFHFRHASLNRGFGKVGAFFEFF
jgi:hypothetical protein